MDPFVPHGKVNTAWAPALGHNQSWFWQSPALFLLRPTSNFQKMPGNNKGMTWAKGSSAEAVWARLCDGRGRKATCMDVKHPRTSSLRAEIHYIKCQIHNGI